MAKDSRQTNCLAGNAAAENLLAESHLRSSHDGSPESAASAAEGARESQPDSVASLVSGVGSADHDAEAARKSKGQAMNREALNGLVEKWLGNAKVCEDAIRNESGIVTWQAAYAARADANKQCADDLAALLSSSQTPEKEPDVVESAEPTPLSQLFNDPKFMARWEKAMESGYSGLTRRTLIHIINNQRKTIRALEIERHSQDCPALPANAERFAVNGRPYRVCNCKLQETAAADRSGEAEQEP
jgi:hypothetical protein